MKKDEYLLKVTNAVDFVERNLNNSIQLSDVSKHAFSSLSHFHRIFYFMTGFSLKEYIRRRRLSNAAIQLTNTKRSIIDIPLEAQFDTPESFNRAFKKIFILSPSEFRNQKTEFQIIRKLEIASLPTVVQPQNLSLNFVYLPQQWVIGLTIRTTLENNQQTIDIPNFFADTIKNGCLANISQVKDEKRLYGIYSDMTDEEDFDYTIGLLVNCESSSTDYTCHLLPAAEYARFTLHAPANQLENAWRYIYGSWMPTSGRSRQTGFDFEIYSAEHTDIYIPMKSSH